MNKKCPKVTKWIIFITDGTALLLVQNDLLYAFTFHKFLVPKNKVIPTHSERKTLVVVIFHHLLASPRLQGRIGRAVKRHDTRQDVALHRC